MGLTRYATRTVAMDPMLSWRVYQGGGGDCRPRALTARARSSSGEMADNEVDFSFLLRPAVPTRFFAKGETIFREGEPGDEFFIVVRGKVEIRCGNRRIETLGPKGIIGEMALIDDSSRSATVVALTDVTVTPVKEMHFLFLVKHMPKFALMVMRVLAKRLRRQNKAV